MSTAAASILEDFRRRGLTARAEGGEVIVTPRERVTPVVELMIRKHKPAILAALAQESGASPSPSMPAPRPEHQATVAPSAPTPHPALESRRALVLAQLEAHPELPRAFDVRDAPLKPEAGPPVSVVLAIRTPAGVVTGEVHIPRERFDMAGFVAALDHAPPSSPPPEPATLH